MLLNIYVSDRGYMKRSILQKRNKMLFLDVPLLHSYSNSGVIYTLFALNNILRSMCQDNAFKSILKPLDCIFLCNLMRIAYTTFPNLPPTDSCTRSSQTDKEIHTINTSSRVPM